MVRPGFPGDSVGVDPFTLSKSPTSGIQLFPFLAVLISALGALILLLLVTTRRMKQVAFEKATHARLEQLDELARQPVASGSAPAFEGGPVNIASIAEPDDSAQRAEHERLSAELRAQWKSIVDDLTTKYATQVKTLAALRAETLLKQQQSEAEIAALEVEHTRLFKRQQELQIAREAAAAEVAQLADQEKAVHTQVGAARRAVQIKAEDLANRPVEFTLMPYDGQLGTVRRPIIIECTEYSINFVCENIQLTAEQLSGFPPDYNPLLAGSRALFEYWTVRDRQNAKLSTPPPPYVLLIVRPKGTVGFYVARRLLEKFDQPYGYELVTDDMTLTWPPSEDAACRVCRESVERVLAERDRLASRAPGQKLPVGDELRYDDQGGAFSTVEVDRLRNLDDSVVVGGQRWKRDSSSQGGVGFPGSSGGEEGPGPQGGGSAAGNGGGGRNGSGGAGGARRDLANSRTFQGLGGPRLGPSGPSRSPETVVRPKLQPFHEDIAPLPERLEPQGTGPIAMPKGQRHSYGGVNPPPGAIPSVNPSRGGTEGGAGTELARAMPSGRKPSNDGDAPSLTTSAAGGETAPSGVPVDGVMRGTPGSAPGGPPHKVGDADAADAIFSEGNGEGGFGSTGARGGAAAPFQVGGPGGASGSASEDGGQAVPSGTESIDPGNPGTTRGWRPNGEPGGSAEGLPSGGAGSAGGPPRAGSAPPPSHRRHAGDYGENRRSEDPHRATGSLGEGAGHPLDPPEGMPIPKNLRSIGQGSTGDASGKPERRWGDNAYAGSIAIERTVQIHVREDSVIVDDEPPIPLKNGAAYVELQSALAHTLDGHVAAWGKPPSSFYWLPNVKFRIHPGGNQYYRALKALTDEWGMKSTAEQEIE
jgi:hypothetical protein